jgi:1,4-alpha-glucan branching enzyme
MKEVRTILLGLLQRGQLYGYQIKKALDGEQFHDWLAVPVASLYNELNKMANEGLIERVGTEAAEGRPARNVYRITPAGREELARALRAAWVSTERERTPLDIAAFFMDALPQADIVQALRERVRRLEEESRQLEGRVAAEWGRPGPRPMVVDLLQRLRMRAEGERQWTQGLVARVEAGEYAPHAPAAAPARRASRRRTTPGLGAFTFVLHSHLPYCRLAGQWPHGEEWIHEAAAETYVPLLDALYDLRDEGVAYRLTVSLTPVLAEQLADDDIKGHFLVYLAQEIEAAERDIPRFGEAGEEHREYLARYYVDYYRRVRQSFLDRFGGDIIGAYRRLQDEGYIEIITSAATHGYLPLLDRDSSIYGQLRSGVESYRRHLGRSPRAIWLPECAYRPAYVGDDGTVRPALEEFLAPLGLTCFFAETHAIEGGRPVGKAAGEVAIGPYGAVTRRYVLPVREGQEVAQGGTTYQAYYVVGGSRGLTEPPVGVIGRNNRTGQQVWSADLGYPGEADYREFHKKDEESGLQYWRVTGPRVDLGAKDYYHPDWAAQRVNDHARHFAGLVEQLAREYHEGSGKYGIIASNYDAELFGHWWFEGIDWIREVLRLLSESDIVDLVTASEYLDAHQPDEVMAVPESSWGVGGTHWTWDNDATHWMWQPIHEAEGRMERLVELYPDAQGDELAILNQAARELLLLESSDWPFLVTTGQADEYASERFGNHVERFRRLADIAEQGVSPEARAYADGLYELDKVFPDIDYHWFAARQGKAE